MVLPWIINRVLFVASISCFFTLSSCKRETSHLDTGFKDNPACSAIVSLGNGINDFRDKLAGVPERLGRAVINGSSGIVEKSAGINGQHFKLKLGPVQIQDTTTKTKVSCNKSKCNIGTVRRVRLDGKIPAVDIRAYLQFERVKGLDDNQDSVCLKAGVGSPFCIAGMPLDGEFSIAAKSQPNEPLDIEANWTISKNMSLTGDVEVLGLVNGGIQLKIGSQGPRIKGARPPKPSLIVTKKVKDIAELGLYLDQDGLKVRDLGIAKRLVEGENFGLDSKTMIPIGGLIGAE